MKYEVIRHFRDALDGNYDYPLGATYPREGLNPSEQRIKELMTVNNKLKAKFIKPLAEKPAKKAEPEKVEESSEEVVWTAEEIDKMPFMKLKSVAKKNGVEVDDKKADEIRSALKEKLEL